jgi:hypothetical protein
MTVRRMEPAEVIRVLVGVAAVVFPLIYFVSDVVESVQGDFTVERLTLTYLGEAAIPLFVLGLYGMQRPTIGSVGLLGAVLYAYSFVFFTSTVVFALFGDSRDWSAVTATFGAWLTVHGALMVVGGLAFGWAVWRARVLPVWTGPCLAVGVVLVAVASGLPILVRTGAAAVPDAAFIGMGWAVLRQAVTARSTPSQTVGEDEIRMQPGAPRLTSDPSPGERRS